MKKDFFQLKERHTTVKTEFLAGFTTFVTMVYILAVNPIILSQAGIPAGAVFSATVIASVIAMLIMGLFANLPIGLSSAMGLNAFFAYTVCLGMGYSYQIALTAVFCEGIVFLLLSLFNVREAIVHALPDFLKSAIVAGIGFFIAFVGLQSGSMIIRNEATLVSLGDIYSAKTALTLVGLFLCLFLYAKNVKGAFLITIFVVSVLGIPFGVTKIPENFRPVSLPDKPLFFDFEWHNILTADFFVVFFTFFFMDLFDTIGTLIGICKQGKIMKEDGSVPRLKQAFFADAFGTICGAILGTSTVSSYVESAAGVASGGKTGLTALVVAGFFLIALFFSPIFLLIPASATAPILIMVGFLMVQEIKEIDFSDFSKAFSSFIAFIMMPLSYSIAEGIVFGVLSYVFCLVAQGRRKEVSPVLWVLFVAFLFKLFF